MSLSQLIEVLDRAGVDLDANAILDAIWLARQEPSFDIVHEEGAQNPVQSPVEPDKRMTLPLKRGSQEKTSEPVVEREQGFAMDGAPTLPIFAGVTQGAGRRASAFSTIAASPLFDTLSFQRALRPFRDRVAGRDAEIVDEEATAERSAEVSAGRALRVVPVVVPARERWFQVDLVTEEDPAAEVWREVLAAFAQAMRNSGAFRDVREWKLDLGPAGNGPATLHAPGGAVLPAAALAGERRLILFASHGCSTHWSSGAYAALLYKWARDCAVALIQLLPGPMGLHRAGRGSRSGDDPCCRRRQRATRDRAVLVDAPGRNDAGHVIPAGGLLAQGRRRVGRDADGARWPRAGHPADTTPRRQPAAARAPRRKRGDHSATRRRTS